MTLVPDAVSDEDDRSVDRLNGLSALVEDGSWCGNKKKDDHAANSKGSALIQAIV